MSFSIQTLKRIVTEIQDILSNPISDIKVHTNEDDICDITADIRGPDGTPFEGGVWRIKLQLNDDFPSAPPKGRFVTKIFHPNVSSKGEICVNTLKQDWKPELGIRHVLLTIRCLLINPNPESALNEEAGKLLLEDYECYCLRARIMSSVHGKMIKWDDHTLPHSSTSQTTSASNLSSFFTQRDFVSIKPEQEQLISQSKENNLAKSNINSQAKKPFPTNSYKALLISEITKTKKSSSLRRL